MSERRLGQHVLLTTIIRILNSLVNPFGQVIDSSYSALVDNAILKSNTTLYCVTDINFDLQVVWTYEHIHSTIIDMPSTTNASTGVSTLRVNTTHPGYYSCEVIEKGGSGRTYRAVMADIRAGMID